jgi:hypothetical protein
MRGIQYAAAHRFNLYCLWNTGSPAFAGDDKCRSPEDLLMTDAPAATSPVRFREQTIAFDGITGRNIDIPSASPLNYHQVISKPADMPPVTIDGKLFLPASTASKKLPLVMIVPGSLGVAPSHVAHAETLTRAGFASFVLDSFAAMCPMPPCRRPHPPPISPMTARSFIPPRARAIRCSSIATSWSTR